MLIAGEPSGDKVAAELVVALRSELEARAGDSYGDLQPLNKDIAPIFFGAGGPAMMTAGVDLEVDMMGHAVTGLTDVIKNFGNFRTLFNRLKRLAIERQPDVVICVDFSGFNRPFAGALRNYVDKQAGTFRNWRPKIVQLVSPQVWASRPGRAKKLTRELDLLLSIIPFEKDWYAKRTPGLNVEFIGHPIIDRYLEFNRPPKPGPNEPPIIALLPGSRRSELNRHLPPILEAVKIIAQNSNARFEMVLPDEPLIELARSFEPPPSINLRVGGLPELLSTATLAIVSTGTVTMECAYFGVPTVALYKTSWSTYQIGKRIITVRYMAMPNLLADEALFPEFVQHEATGENLSSAALDLLNNPGRRNVVQKRLSTIVNSLGQPGAPQRAAQAVLKLF